MDTNAVIESLAAKLAAADLDDTEAELLRALIAPPTEVEGFSGLPTGKRQHKPFVIWPEVLQAGASTLGWSWGEGQLE